MNQPDDEGRTPLHWAIQMGHIEIAMDLIDKGADVNCNNYAGLQPLHLAVLYGYPQIVKKLIEKGVAINPPDKEGKSPLHWAIYYAYTEIVIILIAGGADVNQKDKQGRIPLQCITHRTVREASGLSMLFLIKSDADVDHLDNESRSSLYYAASYGQTEMLKILIGAKAKVNIRDEDKNTPLHAAVSFGKIENVKLLIDAHAEINATNDKMMTPLHLAVRLGRIEIIKTLIEAKANIDAVDMQGETPLFDAVFSGHIDAVKFLIFCGANIHHINHRKETLLDIACICPQEKMQRLLIDYFRLQALHTLRPLSKWEWNVSVEHNHFCYYLQWLPQKMVEDVILQFEPSVNRKEEKNPVTNRTYSLVSYAPFPAPLFSYLLSAKVCPEENNRDTAVLKTSKTR